MGYRLEYGPVIKVRRKEKLVSRKAALTAVCLFLFAGLVGHFWPEGAEVLRRLVFPGDPAVTAAAVDELTWELHAGADVYESLQHFCLRILEGAELASVR